MIKIIAWHGTNIRFDNFDQSKARMKNDYFGGAVGYFTDNRDIAKSYARSNYKKLGGAGHIYEVELNIKKVFDVDKEFTGKELTKFFDKSTLKDFAIGTKLARLGGEDLYIVMGKLEDGKYTLNGDIIFKALSRGMNATAKARETLKKLGYNCLRYNGGIQSQGQHHNVYCMYDAQDIKMKKIYTFGGIKLKEENLNEMKIPPSTLNISRNLMPQITSNWIEHFLIDLQQKNIQYKETKILAKILKPTQSEFNMKKAKRMKHVSGEKPILISRDFHILDGHHRWLAILNQGNSRKINCLMIDLPILELIRLARSFKQVSYRSINETIKKVVLEKHRNDKYNI